MRMVLVALAGLCAMAPARAPAEAWQPMEARPYAPHFTVGVRSGYSWGLGDIDSSTALSDAVGYQVPVQLDVGWRFSPSLSIGAYASYGFARPTGLTKETCDSFRLSCSASALRAGLQLLTYSSAGGRERSPLWRDPRARDENSTWLGVGIGYDSITVTMGDADLTATGFEWVAQGGIDFYTGPRSTLGVFASVSVARFTRIDAGGTSGTISGQRLHEWITLGLRGEFGR